MRNETRRKLSSYLPAGVILAVIAALYLPALQIYLIGDDFEYLDDVYSGWADPAGFFRLAGLFFRPLLKLSYLVNYTLFTTHAPFYLAGNIAIHLINVWLLYLLLLKCTDSVAAAGLTALLFGTSPMPCEAVVWSGGHADAMLAVCFLGVFVVLAEKEKPFSRRRWLLSLFLIFAAAGAKDTWIILPFLVVSFLCFMMRAPFKKALWPAMPAFVLMAAYVSVFLAIPRLTGTVSPSMYAQPNLTAMLQKASYLMYKYIGLGAYFYGDLWQTALIWLLAAGLLAVLLVCKNHLGLWGLSWLALTVLITLPVKFAPSRYDYLPLMGFWIVVIAFLRQGWQFLSRRWQIRRRLLFFLMCAFLCAILPYQAIMLQYDIHDYKKLGDAHQVLVEMYRGIQAQIPRNVPFVFINQGIRRPIQEVEQSFQGNLKLLFARPEALWQLVKFAPLANFTGTPFQQRMFPVQAEDFEKILPASFQQLLIFTDQGFFWGTPEMRQALQQFYRTHGQLPAQAGIYRLIPVE